MLVWKAPQGLPNLHAAHLDLDAFPEKRAMVWVKGQGVTA